MFGSGERKIEIFDVVYMNKHLVEIICMKKYMKILVLDKFTGVRIY